MSPLFFIKFLFFPQMITLQDLLKKCFLFHLKSSFRSEDILIFVVFSLLFHTLMSWICLHKFADVNFRITLKEYTSIHTWSSRVLHSTKLSESFGYVCDIAIFNNVKMGITKEETKNFPKFLFWGCGYI